MASRSASRPRPCPCRRVVRKMSRPTERYIGSVFSSQRQPAGHGAVDDDREAGLGPEQLLAVGLLGLRPPPARDRGLGEDGEDGVEVVLDERAQEHALAAQRGEIHARQCRAIASKLAGQPVAR